MDAGSNELVDSRLVRDREERKQGEKIRQAQRKGVRGARDEQTVNSERHLNAIGHRARVDERAM